MNIAAPMPKTVLVGSIIVGYWKADGLTSVSDIVYILMNIKNIELRSFMFLRKVFCFSF